MKKRRERDIKKMNEISKRNRHLDDERYATEAINRDAFMSLANYSKKLDRETGEYIYFDNYGNKIHDINAFRRDVAFDLQIEYEISGNKRAYYLNSQFNVTSNFFKKDLIKQSIGTTLEIYKNIKNLKMFTPFDKSFDIFLMPLTFKAEDIKAKDIKAEDYPSIEAKNRKRRVLSLQKYVPLIHFPYISITLNIDDSDKQNYSNIQENKDKSFNESIKFEIDNSFNLKQQTVYPGGVIKVDKQNIEQKLFEDKKKNVQSPFAGGEQSKAPVKLNQLKNLLDKNDRNKGQIIQSINDFLINQENSIFTIKKKNENYKHIIIFGLFDNVDRFKNLYNIFKDTFVIFVSKMNKSLLNNILTDGTLKLNKYPDDSLQEIVNAQNMAGGAAVENSKVVLLYKANYTNVKLASNIDESNNVTYGIPDSYIQKKPNIDESNKNVTYEIPDSNIQKKPETTEKLLLLQGSASYLAIALNIDGKGVTVDKYLEKIE